MIMDSYIYQICHLQARQRCSFRVSVILLSWVCRTGPGCAGGAGRRGGMRHSAGGCCCTSHSSMRSAASSVHTQRAAVLIVLLRDSLIPQALLLASGRWLTYSSAPFQKDSVYTTKKRLRKHCSSSAVCSVVEPSPR